MPHVSHAYESVPRRTPLPPDAIVTLALLLTAAPELPAAADCDALGVGVVSASTAGDGESDGVIGVVGEKEMLGVALASAVPDGVSPWPSEFVGVKDGVASADADTVAAADDEADAPDESDGVDACEAEGCAVAEAVKVDV